MMICRRLCSDGARIGKLSGGLLSVALALLVGGCPAPQAPIVAGDEAADGNATQNIPPPATSDAPPMYATAGGHLFRLSSQPPYSRDLGATGTDDLAVATMPDGTLYGVDRTTAANASLYRLNTATGAATRVAQLQVDVAAADGGVNAAHLAAAPSGKLYLVPQGSGLYEVDPANGIVRPLFAGTKVHLLTFTADGRALARTATVDLGFLDLATGAVTSVVANPFPLARDMRGLVAAKDGYYYALVWLNQNSTEMHRIEPRTGSTMVLVQYPIALYGLTLVSP